MASFRHREATVIGSPANLAARMDGLTKEPNFKALIDDGEHVLVSKDAMQIINSFNSGFEFKEVNLEEMHLIMKSFPEEKRTYLFQLTQRNISLFNEVLTANAIQIIEAAT